MSRLIAPALLALVAAGTAACGEDTSVGTGPATPSPREVTELTVEMRPGTGEPETWTLTCDPVGGSHPTPAEACALLEEVGPEAFEPVPDDAVCTEVYGGPEEATVTGTLRGERIEAEFSRVNGCEIARWDALTPLLPPATA